MSKQISYRREDGVVGVGFKIEYGGISQHSVSWPDRPAERYSDESLTSHGITSSEFSFDGDGAVDAASSDQESSGQETPAQPPEQVNPLAEV